MGLISYSGGWLADVTSTPGPGAGAQVTFYTVLLQQSYVLSVLINKTLLQLFYGGQLVPSSDYRFTSATGTIEFLNTVDSNIECLGVYQ